MIEKFQLQFGRAPGSAGNLVNASAVTVFVGPNNSGKSKVLSEITQYCFLGTKHANAVILEHLAFTPSPGQEALQAIEHIRLSPAVGEMLSPGTVILGARGARNQVNLETMIQIMQNPDSNPNGFCQWFLAYSTLMLDGRSRINLVNPQPGGDLLQSPQTSLQVLFRSAKRREEVRRIVFEAFGLHLIIDPTNLGQLRIRLSDRAPKDQLEETGLHSEAIQFQAKAQSIELASDGVKAFTGIITELIAGDPRVVLIDEPEAFLHPSLAFKLGTELSRAAIATKKRVFASTHSASFVMGCIQSGAPVNIIRLTYRSGVATARLLPSAELLELMRNPLLRSTGVVGGLFYEFVVVTEADTDRAFYQEVNERLLRFKPQWGIPNCLFLNAQNKQTLRTLMRPLRELGIPAAAIVDIDVVKEGGKVWSDFMDSAHIPELSKSSLATLRAELKRVMDATGQDMKREGGISILQPRDQESAKNLFQQLAEYGIFVIPGGELECWMKSLDATGKGPYWLVQVFEKMGEDPDATGYVKPTDSDVWEFISRVQAWLVNPLRKGIPA